LQRQLASGIEEASAAEWALWSNMVKQKQQFPNSRNFKCQRAANRPYSYALLRILESQPLASPAILNLLVKTISKRELQRKLPEPVFERKQLEPTMTQPPKIPAPQTRKGVERLRESNRQLEQVTLALDELIAMVEAGSSSTSGAPRG